VIAGKSSIMLAGAVLAAGVTACSSAVPQASRGAAGSGSPAAPASRGDGHSARGGQCVAEFGSLSPRAKAAASAARSGSVIGRRLGVDGRRCVGVAQVVAHDVTPAAGVRRAERVGPGQHGRATRDQDEGRRRSTQVLDLSVTSSGVRNERIVECIVHRSAASLRHTYFPASAEFCDRRPDEWDCRAGSWRASSRRLRRSAMYVLP
jgi:hypothetical protein